MELMIFCGIYCFERTLISFPMLIVTATTVEEVTLVMNDGTVTVKSNPPFHQAMLLLLEMNHLTSMEDKTIRNTVYV